MIYDDKDTPEIRSQDYNSHYPFGSLESQIEEEPTYVTLPPRAKNLSPRLKSRLSRLTVEEWEFIVKRYDLYEGTPLLAAKSMPYTRMIIAAVWRLSGKTTNPYNSFRIDRS